MNWKEKLRILEQNKDWDSAIEFMQKIIAENQNNIDAYLSINYLLMNLLVEEDHDESKHNYYENLCKYYFNESYKRFSNNPEYLYFTAKTAFMSEWFFGIEYEQAEEMLNRALELEPNNLLYQWNLYGSQSYRNTFPNDKLIIYCKMVFQIDSPIQKILKNKGSLGEYLLELMINECFEIISSINKNY